MLTEAKTPKVSVVIPLHNCKRYVCQAVESVLRQSYTNYEIIVVDDGSTDNSHQVLLPYMEQIKYLYQENQGVSAARNQGIEIASGEFVAFLDHDDFFLPNKLELQVACFENKPELGIVHSGWRRVDPQGEPLADVHPWYQAPNLDLEDWVRWKPILPSAMMFRREWLKKAGGFDIRFQQAGDIDLAIRLTLMGSQFAWVSQILVCYREHDANESLNTLVQVEEAWDVLDKFFVSSEVPERIKEHEKEYRYYTLVWSAWRLYYSGYISEMVLKLQKSLRYTPYSIGKTIFNWIESFVRYAEESGFELNIDELSNSEEWQQLMSIIVNC
ncbi:MAG: glycosyltransferase [Okeania sp. SIO1H6]|nr:glycosyltransferase [Okeania sp. SIO1H6]